MAAVTVDEMSPDDSFTVRRIRIEGARAVSKGAVRGEMLTRMPPWYKPWEKLWKAPELNASLLRTDLERIAALLRDEGYYQADVDHELRIDGRQVEVVIRIDEGPPVIVDEIEVLAGDFEIEEAARAALIGRLELRTGRRFTQERYDSAWRRLSRFYLDQGYAHVRTEKSATVDLAENTARVRYVIERGPEAVFGTTTVEGLDAFRDLEWLIHRELLYRSGDRYDPKLIERSQANIFGLHLFPSVVIEPADPESTDEVVDLKVTVVEGEARRLRVGVGYSLEDEARAQLQWQNNNFLGGGRRLGVQFKFSSIEQSLLSELRQPYFLHEMQTLVLPVTQIREDEPGYTVTRLRAAPRVERRLLPQLTVSLGYNIEHDDLTSVPAETQLRLDQFKATGFVSSITSALEWNTTTDLFDPRSGQVVTLLLEHAGGPWMGNFSFYRALLDARRYLPLPGDRVLAGRFRLGAGDGFGQSRDLPMFRRFFAGGIASTRGYGRSRLGPLTAGGSPIGGRSLIEGNIELRTPVWRELGGALFLDMAAVDLRPFHYDLGQLRYGAGPGIRYNTPVGPIRVDIGFPLNPAPGIQRWQFHFSIGQAF